MEESIRDLLEAYGEIVMMDALAQFRIDGIMNRGAWGEYVAAEAVATASGDEALATALAPIGVSLSNTQTLEVAAELFKKFEAVSPTLMTVYDSPFAELAKNGGFFRAPSGEEAIAAAEDRLKFHLPPSYKEFLRITNGCRSYSVDFVGIEKVNPLTHVSPESASGWAAGAEQIRPVPDADYFVYGPDQNPSAFRREYVQDTIAVSSPTPMDLGAWCLLNPRVVFHDQECEAWLLSPSSGVVRYRSFGEMLKAILDADLVSARRRPSTDI